MKEAQFNFQEKNATVWGNVHFIFMIFLSCFCPFGEVRYILVVMVVAVKQHVIMAVDMTAFLLPFGFIQYFRDCDFHGLTKSCLCHQRVFFSLLLTTKLINNRTFWRTCC